jgi:polysaccharide biosynthesis/export protein
MDCQLLSDAALIHRTTNRIIQVSALTLVSLLGTAGLSFAQTPNPTGANPGIPVPSSPVVAVSNGPFMAQGYSDYVLGPGDQISLEIVGYPEFTSSYVVLPDGNIVLPLVGSMPTAGKTLAQTSQDLTARLSYYLVEPSVSVRLAIMRPVIVNMAGSIYRPGPVQLTGLTSSNAPSSQDFRPEFTEGLPTISSALLAAGGVTQDADIRTVMIRRPLPNGQVQDITVNLWEALIAEGSGTNLVLRDGDTVFVPRMPEGESLDSRLIASSTIAPDTVRVRVVGEVKQPGEVRVSPDSSVSGAVAAAGGPTTDAQLSEVALVRLDQNGQVQQEVLDLSSMIDNRQIRDGDVIVVAKRGYLSFFDMLGRILNPLNILNVF